MKEIHLLEQFILDAPVSNSQHQQALRWLSAIIEHYQRIASEAAKKKEQK